MVQNVLIILTALLALIINMAQAKAELSTNPWVEANDEEAVAEIYEKQNRRHNVQSLHYQAGETVTIDRTQAYIQPETEEEEGFFDKVGDLFSSEDATESEPALIPNTAANRRALARQQELQSQESESYVPAFDIGGQIERLQKSLRLPDLPNMNSAIRRFENASGINLKSIGRYMQ